MTKPTTFADVPASLLDSAQKQYDFAHGDSSTVIETENGEVPSMAKAVADLDQSYSALAAVSETAAARDAAISSAAVAAGVANRWTTITAGLAATADGHYFSVKSSVSGEDLAIYQNASGVAVRVGFTADPALVTALSGAALTSDTKTFNGDGDVVIVGFADASGRSPMYVTDDGAAHLNGVRIGNDQVVSVATLLFALTDGSAGRRPWIRCFDDGYVHAGWNDWPDTPAPIYQLAITGVYKSGATTPDPDLEALRLQQIAGLTSFSLGVSQYSDAGLFDADQAQGLAAAGWLLDWARAGSMAGKLGGTPGQANLERFWTIPAWALGLFKIAKIAPLGPKRDAIHAWLVTIGAQVISDMDSGNVPQNNLMYWGAYALLCIWHVTGTQAYYDRALMEYKTAIGRISDAGGISSEMDRGVRALPYNEFALSAMVNMAEIAAINGFDWYGYSNGRIHLAVEAVMHGAQDALWWGQNVYAYPAQSEASAQERIWDEAAYEADITAGSSSSAWFHYYAGRFPDKPAGRYPVHYDTLYNLRIGGDLPRLAPYFLSITPATLTAIATGS